MKGEDAGKKILCVCAQRLKTLSCKFLPGEYLHLVIYLTLRSAFLVPAMIPGTDMLFEICLLS